MATILVTGSQGQLGSELQVLAPLYPQFNFLFTDSQQLDITSEAEVNAFFMQHRPQYCINAAAYTAVDKAETEPDAAFAVNAKAVGYIARAADVLGCQLLQVSTDYVFDGSASAPIGEDAQPRPLGVYGQSKWEGELQAMEKSRSTIIIRTSWVYSSFGKNFVKTMLRLMAQRETIGVVNDQFGSPTYAADLAKALLEMTVQLEEKDFEENPAGIYHYANEGAISWYDFAVAIAEMSGSKCVVEPIPTSAYPTPAQRPAYSVFSKKKIERVFHLPILPWKDSLQACLLQLQGYLAG